VGGVRRPRVAKPEHYEKLIRDVRLLDDPDTATRLSAESRLNDYAIAMEEVAEHGEPSHWKKQILEKKNFHEEWNRGLLSALRDIVHTTTKSAEKLRKIARKHVPRCASYAGCRICAKRRDRSWDDE
jgi:hypothetical protein